MASNLVIIVTSYAKFYGNGVSTLLVSENDCGKKLKYYHLLLGLGLMITEAVNLPPGNTRS
jgi:hypothetical protein